jgi:peptidoglycan DL-endopeptidase CwlO
MSRRAGGLVLHTLAVTSIATAVAGVLLPVPTAGADPLASARAKAAALSKQVTALETRAEVASQRYDAIEQSLAQAVTAQIHADEALDASTTTVAQARAGIADRARALYESGPSSGLLTGLLTGDDPVDAADRSTLASSALAYDTAQAGRAQAALSAATTLERQDTAATAAVTTLQKRASSAANSVRSLLAAARDQQTAASATVRRLAAADALAAQDADSASAAGLIADAPDATTTAVAGRAITAARTRIGDAYVWGATGPTTFDCSGLTQWSYAHAGISLPRTAAEQWSSGPHPALSALQPGDLLFWATDTSDPATIHHVAIYLGGGMMIAAPHTGTDVQIQAVYAAGLIGATRPTA